MNRYDLIDMLKMASDRQLDPSMMELVRKWTQPPRAIEVLEVLDRCIHGGLASDLVIAAMQALYSHICNAEGVTHDEIVKLAAWREELGRE